jgi:serine/threonine-protein kinase/endoribonuclease IRE1
MATVDGRIHAVDRYTGIIMWHLDVGGPVVETVYTHNHSEGASINNPPFLWIVEPKEEGALYILTPGHQPRLESLDLTVKQLAEDLAPYSTLSPPLVYTADKQTVMLIVDARTGEVRKSFSTGGGTFVDEKSCVAQKAAGYFGNGEDECRGLLHLGRTEYTISVLNETNGEKICTLKYSEWMPNAKDRDLHAQYRATIDDTYVHPRYDGKVIALDHRRAEPTKRPVFTTDFSSPVVRVFDVAKQIGDADPEAPLVLLPQPPDPNILEDRKRNVWLNTTEEGSWYALSELHYPYVTEEAPQALCYSPEWSNNNLLNLDNPHFLPNRRGLVGVHILNYEGEPRSTVLGIEGPTTTPDRIVSLPELPDRPSHDGVDYSQDTEIQQDDIRETHNTVGNSHSWPRLTASVMCAVVIASIIFYSLSQPTKLASLKNSILSNFNKGRLPDPRQESFHKANTSDSPASKESTVDLPELSGVASEDVSEPVTETKPLVIEPEKKVRFEIPEEDDEGLEPLSRTTTAELEPSPAETDEAALPVDESGNAAAANDAAPATPAAPTRKKKAHRGKRGGVKKPRRPKDGEEVNQNVKDSVEAAKDLQQGPSLHPDEVTVTDDVQDVSNIKRIGKLTIDQDRLLGNGSGGTFVFEGKWNVSSRLISLWVAN